MNSKITYISLSVIIVAFIAAWAYIIILNQKNKIIEKRRWVEQLPSIVSTLGVIGTFLGITLGLTKFDPKDISASIPTLLEGLKTAFFTSLAGMTGSLVLSRTISRIFDKKEKGLSDINLAAAQITQAMNQVCQTIIQNSTQQTAQQTAFFNSTSQLLAQMQSIQTKSGNTLAQLVTLQNSQTQDLTTINNHIDQMNRNVGELATIIDGMASTHNEISDEVKSFGGKLHGEIVEIEDSMDKTNQLLSEKFDEFSNFWKRAIPRRLLRL